MNRYDPDVRQAGPDGAAPSWTEEPAETLKPLVESTRHLHGAEQLDFWRACNGTLAECDPLAEPVESSFLVEAQTWRFGKFALMTATTPAARLRRMPTQIRRDGIDHWSLAVATDGQRVFRVGDTVHALRPGAVLVTSFDQPMISQRTQSNWITLYVPRDAFPDIGGEIDRMRLLPLETSLGLVLHDYLVALAARMPRMRAQDAGRLAVGTHAIIAAALAPSANRMAEASAPVQQVLLKRIRRAVRENLHLATLGPDRLCKMVSISRSKLYRLCEPFDGVAAFIQAERLQVAQRALCDPADMRSIARIATDCGIFDASSFSRMMRRRFGCTPTEMRIAALTGETAPYSSVQVSARQQNNLCSLLAKLGA